MSLVTNRVNNSFKYNGAQCRLHYFLSIHKTNIFLALYYQ
jgi:hypothetical protein